MVRAHPSQKARRVGHPQDSAIARRDGAQQCSAPTKKTQDASLKARRYKRKKPGETRERLLVECDSGDRGGFDGVYSGEFDGTFAVIGGAAAHRFGERVLEDVHDCDSAWGDFDLADLFSREDCEVFGDVSEGGARRPDHFDAPVELGDDCVCGDGDSLFFADEGDWKESGESVCDWWRAADWRDRNVVH